MCVRATAFLLTDVLFMDSHGYRFLLFTGVSLMVLTVTIPFTQELIRIAVSLAEVTRPHFTRPLFYKVLPICNMNYKNN